MFGERMFRQPWLGLPLRPALGGALAGAVVAVLPQAAGNGYEPLNTLLDGRFSASFIALLLAGKCVATVASDYRNALSTGMTKRELLLRAPGLPSEQARRDAVWSCAWVCSRVGVTQRGRPARRSYSLGAQGLYC